MIKLEIPRYCHNCPYFEPVLVGNYEMVTCGGIKIAPSHRTVTCEHSHQCKHVEEYLEKEKQNDQT